MVVGCGFVCGDGEWWVVRVAASEREREKEINKWIGFSCVVKNRTFDVEWIVKRIVKIDKVVFWVAKS